MGTWSLCNPCSQVKILCVIFCSDLEGIPAVPCLCTPNCSVFAFINLCCLRKANSSLCLIAFPLPEAKPPTSQLQSALQLPAFLISHMIFSKYSPVLPLFVAKKPSNRKQKKEEKNPPNKPTIKQNQEQQNSVTADEKKRTLAFSSWISRQRNPWQNRPEQEAKRRAGRSKRWFEIKPITQTFLPPSYGIIQSTSLYLCSAACLRPVTSWNLTGFETSGASMLQVLLPSCPGLRNTPAMSWRRSSIQNSRSEGRRAESQPDSWEPLCSVNMLPENSRGCEPPASQLCRKQAREQGKQTTDGEKLCTDFLSRALLLP